jgi:acetyl-CoA carboxylase carboxyltransferase component
MPSPKTAPADTSTAPAIPAQHQELLAHYAKLEAQMALGGGLKAIEKHKAKGKLTARERIDELLDTPERAVEIGGLAGHDMYQEHGGCPGGGVVVKIGHVSGRLCIIVANDATVKAGAWFPMTAKKTLRAQEIALENHLPIIYLVDSAGVYLPLQDEVFADKEHFGRTFRNNAVLSSRGIPQLSAIMGPCVAGGAYLPIMSDEALIVEGSGSVFLAGPYLVKSAVGEEVDAETLGGAVTHSEISGVTDYKVKDDHECLTKIKRLIGKLGHTPRTGFDRVEPRAPKLAPTEIFNILPIDRAKPYDTHKLIDWLIDEDSWDEYKAGYGKTLVTGYARIEGWSVGIVANQRKVVKTRKGEMQFGGVVYSDSADKTARFILNCNQKRIPLVFLQDVTGFMVGSRSEHGGIIKDGAKLVNAMANSVVPKFTFLVGNSYGAGNYALCGKSYDPRLIYAWHTANLAVMSGASAAKTLLQIQTATLQKKGEVITPEAEEKLLTDITDRYNRTLKPEYGAARLWHDGVIDPRLTRQIIATGIEAANHVPELPRFNPGVIQV